MTHSHIGDGTDNLMDMMIYIYNADSTEMIWRHYGDIILSYHADTMGIEYNGDISCNTMTYSNGVQQEYHGHVGSSSLVRILSGPGNRSDLFFGNP